MSSMIGRYLCDSPMVNQGYTYSKKKNLYKSKQKHNLSDIIKGSKGWLEPQKKTNKKFGKGVFRNNA